MKSWSLNIRGKVVEFRRPAVMAIINATPDSFYSGARHADSAAIERAISEGADIVDLGAYSSRPGAPEVSAEEEWARLSKALKALRALNSDIPVSVDTFRAEIARRALAEGADMVNDISGGMLDPQMDAVVAQARAPYIIMHLRGTPATMQQLTDYPLGVTAEVLSFFARRVSELQELGINDIILDPGFGFAKTTEQNYELLRKLPLIKDTLRRPILAGLSRKSMLYRPMGLTPEEALPATCAANLAALQGGAAILRVHDVAAARQVVAFHELFAQAEGLNKYEVLHDIGRSAPLGGVHQQPENN